VRNLPYYAASAVAIALLILLVTSLLGVRRSQEILPKAEAIADELTVKEMRDQGGLPIYWLGQTYRGLPIVNIQHVRDPGSPDGTFPPEEYVSIIYASCGAEEGDCPPGEMARFVEVRSEWLCLKPPSLLARGARKGPPIEIRGAQVQETTSGNTHVFFGNSTVIVFASEGEEITLEALGSLEGVNPPGRAVAGATKTGLPPVDEGACTMFVLPTPPPTATPEPTSVPTSTPTATPEGG
jgi:hypothetical protein